MLLWLILSRISFFDESIYMVKLWQIYILWSIKKYKGSFSLYRLEIMYFRLFRQFQEKYFELSAPDVYY